MLGWSRNWWSQAEIAVIRMLKNIVEAKSIFQQVACALAVAEEAIEFEHRDLHWGNILIAPTIQTTIDYVLRDDRFTMTTSGILVTIIDFTLSYLRKDGCTIFTNLADDDSLFTGEGDYQFDIYRLMKENNGNKWDTFSPYSNVLWLHYLLEKLLKEKTYRNVKSHKSVRIQLQKWQKSIFKYRSATDFVTNSDFLKAIEK
ncbi:serine/threonine-protein kinase haspin-like [Centruroides sculpturatus]|uniref:serine/threonine-protein kinase haspin-like n=1 Tax=Centruroides sculpturatus TaxID=218467 RepID=UPI000C6E2703|nr:serine/threonine-protein kinase haspin-like [Centruroides sculpturatus]